MTSMITADSHIPVITIDGPSGSGKGTLCHLIAQKLNWHFLDSGALYRILAFCALKEQISCEDETALAVLAGRLNIKFIPQPEGCTKVLINNQELDKEIRSDAISSLSSKISKYPAVRAALVNQQRDFRQWPGLVTDGRDMGTVIFPDAKLKIYLTANVEERAKRRCVQLKKKGIDANIAQVLDELILRDHQDEARQVAPLKPAEDAVLIDTTTLSIHEVLDQILKLAETRFPGVLSKAF